MQYDYKHQAFVKDGVYVACNHPEEGAMTIFGEPFEGCDCYGKAHAGEPVEA